MSQRDAAFWLQDDDGDLRTNFDEYVELTDPTTPDQPVGGHVDQLPDGSLRLDIHRNLAGTDLDTAIESSSDGVGWEPLNENTWSLSSNEQITRLVIQPAAAPEPTQLFRIISRLKP